MMNLDEAIKWKKIKDFPNYSISNTGLVRNDVTGKLKTLRHDKNGYLARVGCEYCKHKFREQHERPCSLCQRNFMDKFEREEVNAGDE